MKLVYGKTSIIVADFAQASKEWCMLRDTRNLRSSFIKQDPVVVDDSGKAIARVSYNGRIWPMESWTPSMVALYPVETK